MSTTVVILNFNTEHLLQKCLTSLFKNGESSHFNVWVVDNASVDDSISMLKKDFPEVKIIQNSTNLGFAGGNNVALSQVRTENVLLLNSDTIILDNAVDQLTNFLEREKFGIISCKLLNPNKSLQPNAGDLPSIFPIFFWLSGLDDLPIVGKLLPSFHRKDKDFYSMEKEVGWVSGSVMMIKRSVIDKIGLMDDSIFMYGEDVDYCLRAKKSGFKIGWTNSAQIIHLGGGSSKDPRSRQWLGEFKGLIFLYKKHFGLLSAFILRLVIYFFTFLRVVAFLLIGKVNVSRTYAKILFSI